MKEKNRFFTSLLECTKKSSNIKEKQQIRYISFSDLKLQAFCAVRIVSWDELLCECVFALMS